MEERQTQGEKSEKTQRGDEGTDDKSNGPLADQMKQEAPHRQPESRRARENLE